MSREEALNFAKEKIAEAISTYEDVASHTGNPVATARADELRRQLAEMEKADRELANVKSEEPPQK